MDESATPKTFTTNSTNGRATFTDSVLIVDDDAICRDLLESLLQGLGYSCLTACDGEEAIAIIEREKPGIVLLDLNMPKMDGNAVMQCLKDRDMINDVQIIVISSEEDTNTVARSIELGADDHIVKPFDTVILNARIESSVAKHMLRKMQTDEHDRLEHLVEKRTSELELANQQLRSLDKAKNEFLSVLSHELRTPLSGIEIAKILISDRDEMSPKEHQLLYDDLLHSISQLNEIVDHAMILSQLTIEPDQTKTTQLTPPNLRQITPSDLLLSATRQMDARHAPMLDHPKTQGINDAMVIPCHGNLLPQALSAILKLATQFSDHSQKVEAHATGSNGSLDITIKSWGYRVPEKHLGNLFKFMAIPDSLFPGGDLGLGAVMARQVLLLHGGDVSVQNHDEGGVTFSICIPMKTLAVKELSL